VLITAHSDGARLKWWQFARRARRRASARDRTPDDTDNETESIAVGARLRAPF